MWRTDFEKPKPSFPQIHIGFWSLNSQTNFRYTIFWRTSLLKTVGLKVFLFEHLRGRHSSALFEQHQRFNFFQDYKCVALDQFSKLEPVKTQSNRIIHLIVMNISHKQCFCFISLEDANLFDKSGV